MLIAPLLQTVLWSNCPRDRNGCFDHWPQQKQNLLVYLPSKTLMNWPLTRSQAQNMEGASQVRLPHLESQLGPRKQKKSHPQHLISSLTKCSPETRGSFKLSSLRLPDWVSLLPAMANLEEKELAIVFHDKPKQSTRHSNAWFTLFTSAVPIGVREWQTV